MQTKVKETDSDKTIVFFVTFLSLVAFQLRVGGACLPGYAYGWRYIIWTNPQLLIGVVHFPSFPVDVWLVPM